MGHSVKRMCFVHFPCIVETFSRNFFENLFTARNSLDISVSLAKFRINYPSDFHHLHDAFSFHIRIHTRIRNNHIHIRSKSDHHGSEWSWKEQYYKDA